jgi:hypothetical protein
MFGLRREKPMEDLRKLLEELYIMYLLPNIDGEEQDNWDIWGNEKYIQNIYCKTEGKMSLGGPSIDRIIL